MSCCVDSVCYKDIEIIEYVGSCRNHNVTVCKKRDHDIGGWKGRGWEELSKDLKRLQLGADFSFIAMGM